MSRKTARVIVDDGEIERVELNPEAQRAAELAELEELNEQEDGELFRVTDELRATQGVRLIFTRTLPAEQAGYVGEMTPAEFTMERIKQSFGPGTYKVRCMGPRGFVKGGGTVRIAASATPTQATTPLDAYFAMMQQIDEKQSARMLQYAQIFGPVLVAVLGRNSGPDLSQLLPALRGPSLADITATLSNLKQLSGAESTPVDQFVKALTVAKELTTGSTGETNWLDVVREVLGAAKPALQDVITGIAKSQALSTGVVQGAVGSTAPLLTQSNPAVALSPVTSDSSPTISTEGAPMFGQLQLMQWLRGELDKLIIHAQKDHDPELYAEVLLDSIPDGVSIEMLLPYLGRSDWWQVLSSFHPNVAPYFGWFLKLRTVIIEMIQEASSSRPNSDTVLGVKPPVASGVDAGALQRSTKGSGVLNAATLSTQQEGSHNDE